jgi:hypothetical protein
MAARNAGSKKHLPDYMPILNERMARGDYLPHYEEREITEPVDLCDERGILNPEAVGWSRSPLVRANLSGHWPRKKKWNFWNWISPDFVFSVTLADLDYASFCSVSFTDFETAKNVSAISIKRAHRVRMPEHVERSVGFEGGGMVYSNVSLGDTMKVDFDGQAKGGERIVADFEVRRPQRHESLNIVVPWTSNRFQLNSKHNTLPCEGDVTVGGKRYTMDPGECHAVQDFGRGIWPYRSFWNWAVCTGVQGGDRIGVNMGARWTTRTGTNENGICVNGRLYKIMEDLCWSYEPSDWMQPWRIRSHHSDTIDLTLHPVVVNRSKIDLFVLASGGACSFGHWRGVIRFDGNTVEIDGLIGWAEEFAHRW